MSFRDGYLRDRTGDQRAAGLVGRAARAVVEQDDDVDGPGRAASAAMELCRSAAEAAGLVAKLEATPREQWAAMLVSDGKYWGSARERRSVEAKGMKKELAMLEREVGHSDSNLVFTRKAPTRS